MKRGLNKRGLSPVIATVLLVFLVLVLAAIIFLWASGFFSEQLEKGGESIENQCRKVAFDVEVVGTYGGGSLVELDFSNTGEIGIFQISIKETMGGDEESYDYLVNIERGESRRIEINLRENNPEEITIYPVLLGSVVGGDGENKPKVCINSPTRVPL